MKWKQERDLLIAQTLAFVQSVSGKTTEPEGAFATIRQQPAEPVKGQRPVESVPAIRPIPAGYSDVREEIRGRVAAFRAHQELFRRDRDEYCKSVLAKARAATETPSKASDDQPIKG